MTGAGHVLEVEGLRVWYATPKGRLVAVDGIDLVVEAGECVGLVGESGSGKSSLARAILGLLPEGAGDEGELRVAGEPVIGASPSELRALRGEKVALIFQEPMSRLDPLMRVEDQFVEMIRAHRRDVTRDEARRMCHTTLASLGIPPLRARQYPHEFSGGMRQRIMIGLAIVLEPRLVVADEPTTALDTLVQAQILEILRSLADDLGIAVLLITHNIGAVAETCDRVAVMYAAKVVEVGSAQQVLGSPGHPYTQGLIASVINLDTETLSSIPGSPPDLADPPPGCRFHPRCPHVMDVCRSVEPPAVAVGDGTVACWLHVPEASRPAPAAFAPGA
ncbi:MAG: peptide/nickel transport system ATP-binding protein [Actinomycetota bacterium]|nr:peptide/nickel transport system ATP-binding protein [Actinomycetota bacterium]